MPDLKCCSPSATTATNAAEPAGSNEAGFPRPKHLDELDELDEATIS